MYSDKIFKAYDVRGVYPGELNEESARDIGRAVAKLSNAGKVVVGRDMRLSSLSLHQALIDGLLQGGAIVDDLEEVPIDAVYFAVGKFGYDAGVMVTASHNPAEYNGFKIVGKAVAVVRGVEIKNLITDSVSGVLVGTSSERNIWPDYIAHLLSFVDQSSFRPLKVVVDAGNGMAGKVIPQLFVNLPFQLTPLWFDLDGSFPNRPSNPLAPGATQVVSAKVKEVGADIGIMFDGDTDRMFLIDEQGGLVPADVTLLLMAREFLRRSPGASIAYNLICSRAVPELISKWGGVPVKSAVGYANVREALVNNNGVMGGELSAHYSFKDNYYADSGFIAALMVLELLSREGKPLSELVREYAPYAKSPEVNLEVKDASAVMTAIKQKYSDAQIDELDGVTVEYADWWFNARASNTEPLLRVTVEANTKEMLDEKVKEVVDFVKKMSS